MGEVPHARRVLVLHGPNLNRLGAREPEVYGAMTLGALNARLREEAQALRLELDIEQSNHEGVLIDRLHAADADAVGVVLNPGGLTHTSVALADAIRAISIPVVEVHLSNLYKREDFRQRSLTGAAGAGVIMGFGAQSYALALRVLSVGLAPLPSQPPARGPVPNAEPHE